MLGKKEFLRSIRLHNILSFGPETEELELKSLNVVIGPNGSGKSNLIEAISLLQAAPRDLFEPIRNGGGISEWLWKGSPERTPVAQVYVTVSKAFPLRHQIQFTMLDQRARLVDETVSELHELYGYHGGQPRLSVLRTDNWETTKPQDIRENESILSQRKDPERFPQITDLGVRYGNIRLYREWSLGRNAVPRRPQPTDLPQDSLQEDASNLSLVLNNLEHHTSSWQTLLESLRNADEAIEKISTRVVGGTIQLYVHYKGLKSPVSAMRLSDGTIRYLCLLAILLHPSPPPLVCIEEPELGMHPDILPTIAKLLIDASHRMQLIVTTHSDVLVDALSEVPEAVVVCEKRNSRTSMTRLSADELATWLKAYGEKIGLGQLWLSGKFGGTRW